MKSTRRRNVLSLKSTRPKTNKRFYNIHDREGECSPMSTLRCTHLRFFNTFLQPKREDVLAEIFFKPFYSLIVKRYFQGKATPLGALHPWSKNSEKNALLIQFPLDYSYQKQVTMRQILALLVMQCSKFSLLLVAGSTN